MGELISFAEKKQEQREKRRQEKASRARKEANEQLQNAFQNLMNDILTGSISLPEASGILQKPNGIEFRETEKALFLKFALKDFKKENLKVRVTDQMICVDLLGNDKMETASPEVNSPNKPIQSISQCVPLPFSVVKEEVKAKFENGNLFLELPRAAESQSSERIVPIE